MSTKGRSNGSLYSFSIVAARKEGLLIDSGTQGLEKPNTERFLGIPLLMRIASGPYAR